MIKFILIYASSFKYPRGEEREARIVRRRGENIFFLFQYFIALIATTKKIVLKLLKRLKFFQLEVQGFRNVSRSNANYHRTIDNEAHIFPP